MLFDVEQLGLVEDRFNVMSVNAFLLSLSNGAPGFGCR